MKLIEKYKERKIIIRIILYKENRPKDVGRLIAGIIDQEEIKTQDLVGICHASCLSVVCSI